MTLHHADDRPTTTEPDTAEVAAPPPELPDRAADDDHHPVLDRTVFGVAAVIVLAFIIWGVAGTASLRAG